jgi:hypothetical protein
MDQIMQHTRMVWTVGVDLLEELGRLCLAIEALRTLSDCAENGQAVEELSLIVGKATIGIGHGVAIAFIPRSFRSRAGVDASLGRSDSGIAPDQPRRRTRDRGLHVAGTGAITLCVET